MDTVMGLLGLMPLDERQLVWSKAIIVPGHDPNRYRQDSFGWWIEWDKYGDLTQQYGWEIDHIWPKSFGGTHTTENLQPLHWRNNASKQNRLF